MSSANVRTDCFFNLSTEERIDLFKRRRSLLLETVYRLYYGKLMLPMAMLGVILTTLYLASSYKAICSRRVSRKCYVLLFNRAIGDILSCLVALATVVYVLFAHEVNRDVVFLFESFFIGSFWSAMVSYTCLSMLKLYAVWKPLDYRRMITMKRCIYVIVFSWLMFMAICVITLGVTALVKVPTLNDWSGCKMETCLRTMYRTRNFATVCIYLWTIFVFIITVLLIKRAEAFSNSFKTRDYSTSSQETTMTMKTIKQQRNGMPRARFPLWKLGLHILTFAGLNVFYVVWCVGLVLNTDQCYFQRNYAEMMRILGCVRLTLVLRICLDPLLSFLTDFQLRRCFLQMLGIKHKISFTSPSGILKREAFTNEESTDGQQHKNHHDRVDCVSSFGTQSTSLSPSHCEIAKSGSTRTTF
ncbi:unnamed protein product, partial [Mesorhabditis belari]|uniref:G-protein coupled receptors family 1 profile domain-containing protein n=1 Tax=Mesorhabditis belari TaxID=2138241 RepID=A0AAF3J717_9BILA